MIEAKHWYESKAVWASILGFIVSMLSTIGLLSVENGTLIVNQLPELMVSLVTALTSLSALYGRVSANKVINSAMASTKTVVTIADEKAVG